MLDEQLQWLDRRVVSSSDHDLALRYAPCIRFDAKEPFLPSVVGYTVFRENASSASFPRDIELRENVAFAIEYAIWWDWDIGHLYELEHIWVYVDSDGHLVDAEASWHGGYNRMMDGGQPPSTAENRLALYSEPGRHAFAPSAQWLLQRKAKTLASCGRHAGKMGVHVTPLFEGINRERKPLNNRLVHTYLERMSFEPTFDFSSQFDLREASFVPWQQLYEWIPGRISEWVRQLRKTIPPDQQRVLRITHRGASAYAQENSADALRIAVELGADMVEIDIRTSADDQPVVVHDSSLKRIYGVEGNVADLSMDELQRLKADQNKIISFEEAIRLCRGLGIGVYLDIKALNFKAAASLFKTLDDYHYVRNTIFGSFRADFLADIKAARPDAQTSILFGAVNIDPVLLAQSIRADYVHPCWQHRAEQPHRLLTPEWIAAVREAELGIVCWHEERPAEIAALKALGVDAICSDRPELLL